MGFNQYKLGHHLTCLMVPEFYASDAASGFEEEDFNTRYQKSPSTGTTGQTYRLVRTATFRSANGL